MKLYVITALVLVVAVAYANAGLLGNFGKLGRFGKNSVQGRQEDKSFGFEGAVRLPYIPEYMVKVQRTMRGKTQSEKSASPAQSSAEARRYRVTERQEAEEEEAQEAEEPGSWGDENERNIFHKTNPKFRRVRRSSGEERQEEAEEEEGAAEEAAERGFLRRGKREDESLTPGFTFLIRGKRSVSKSAKKYSEYPFVAGAGAVDTESEERNEEAEEDQERKYPGGGFRGSSYDPLTEREYNNFGSGIRYRDEERTHHRQRGSAAQSRQERWGEDIEEPEEEQQEEAEGWGEDTEEPGEEQQEEAAEEAAEETGEAPISQQRPAASPQRRRMRRLRSRLGAASTARRRFQSPASDEDARRDFLPDLTLPFNSKHGVPLRGSFGEERRFFNPGASAGVNQRFPLTDH